MKEIDLKKIYKKNLLEIVYRGTPGPNPKSLPYNERGSMNIHMNSPSADAALKSMREVCVLLIELIKQNVLIEAVNEDTGDIVEISKSIFKPHPYDKHKDQWVRVNDDSISNIINKIK